ncbi:MAG: glycosyltransferase [Flavobacterium sp.]|nr:glycosyltransferase [Pedobacter sp.]
MQLYYTLIIHQKLSAYPIRDKVITENQLPLSVIICARNEERNLVKNLPLVLEQEYINYEVVVVNDCSSDGSEQVLRQLSLQYPHLKVLTIEEHNRYKHGKKFAVTLGIKAAKNELLLFTDADCWPAGKQWLRIMSSNFIAGTQIVLGYSPYQKLSGFINNLIRFETFFTALNYLSFALSGQPYMGVGRNLAYTKSLFFKGKGFASHMHILSGDDDLFVNQNATHSNTVIEIHPDAQVWSEPKNSFKNYFKQKLRHQGAGRMYKNAHKLTLTLQAGSAIVFYTGLIILIICDVQLLFILGLYFFRLVTQLVIYFKIFKKLNCFDLLWWFPALDFIYYFYMLALSIITIFKKNIEWK